MPWYLLNLARAATPLPRAGIDQAIEANDGRD
jgi:hypothetical protein